jgi:cell division control protein 6
VNQVISTLPLQQKLVLKVAVNLATRKGFTTTGEVYSVYLEEARRRGLEPLSQRSVSQVLSQLDMMGILIAEVRSMGRHGLTKVIKVKEEVAKLVEKALADT